MANLTNVYVYYEDRQLILHNPNNEDINLTIEDNQLMFESLIFKDAGITEDQLFVEASVNGITFEIIDRQLYFYNMEDDDIDFELSEDGILIASSANTYDDAIIRSNQCFIVLGKEMTMDEITPAIAANIHEAFMQPQRQTYGLVKIVYYNPLMENINTCETTSEGEGSSLADVLKDNDRGWISGNISDANGAIDETLIIRCSKRLLGAINIRFDVANNIFATHFSVTITNGTRSIQREISNYSDTIFSIDMNDVIVDATEIILHFTQLNNAGVPITVEYVDIQHAFEYTTGDLMGIDVLEEITYSDTDAQLGAISANEATIYLNNETHAFDFNNLGSRVARQLKKNRKILPYLGIKAVDPDTGKHRLYWIPCGIFWSHNWVVKQDSPIAQVTGFDTLGLLNKIEFKRHYVLMNVTLVQLLEYILTQAQTYIQDLQYYIDPKLNDVNLTIPVAILDRASFFTVLQNISTCYPIDIYCDRSLRIVCMAQASRSKVEQVTWSNDTIIQETQYPTLYTNIYNIITVNIYSPEYTEGEILQSNDIVYVEGPITRNFTFNGACTNTLDKPPVFNIVKDDTVNVDSIEWYDWGCSITFSGEGQITSVIATGSAVTLNTKAYAQCRDEESITENGENELLIDSNLIQSYSYANTLAKMILNNLLDARYCAEVTNRGDFLTTINDPILLKDGIALNNNYKVKEQSINWDGTLSSTTKLYTAIGE